MLYNIKCENCEKKLNTPTLYMGFAFYSAESHMMETGHIVQVIQNDTDEVLNCP